LKSRTLNLDSWLVTSRSAGPTDVLNVLYTKSSNKSRHRVHPRAADVFKVFSGYARVNESSVGATMRLHKSHRSPVFRGRRKVGALVFITAYRPMYVDMIIGVYRNLDSGVMNRMNAHIT
jgi:hypothetical protein